MVRDLPRDRAVAADERVVANPAEQPVRYPRRAPRPSGNLACAIGRDRDAHNPGRTVHDPDQVGLVVEVEPADDPEPVPERRAEVADLGGRADQGESLEGERDRPGARPIPDHDVDEEILHGRVQDLLDHGRDTVDLVDEEDVALVERGQ